MSNAKELGQVYDAQERCADAMMHLDNIPNSREKSLALTKLDGTARGGVVVAIVEELNLPIRLIGVGEKEEDLQDFNASAFIDALLPQETPPT